MSSENTGQSTAAGMQCRNVMSDGQISLYFIFNVSNTSASQSRLHNDYRFTTLRARFAALRALAKYSKLCHVGMLFFVDMLLEGCSYALEQVGGCETSIVLPVMPLCTSSSAPLPRKGCRITSLAELASMRVAKDASLKSG